MSTLLDWHRNDPVDSWEENRNDIIYYSYQNNRNPFIDHPELAEHLWGNEIGVAWQGALGVDEFSEVAIKLYPNPTSDYLNIAGINGKTFIEIYDPLGKRILSKMIDEGQTLIDVSQIRTGIYLFKLTDAGKSMVKRIVIL